MAVGKRSAEQVPWAIDARAAVIESGFGAAWFGWGQQAPPTWLGPLLVAGAVACGVTFVVGVVALVRGRGPGGPPPRGIRSRYWLLVAAEGVLALAGAVVLARLGRPELIAAWVGVVVGAHFVPLSTIYPGRALVVLGALVVLVGLTAGAVTLVGGGVSSTVAGPGAGLCLLVHAVLLLAGVPARIRRRALS